MEALNGFIPFILIIVIFYFLLIRPQRMQQKKLQEQQNAMKAGDKVVTAGGIHGIVREVEEKTVKIEVSAGVIIKFEKASIVAFVAKEN
ncbi:MAG: preprotein translocase subunit YajC [Akkermansiaceae bacterium]|nr:preprotein translocase subunit YajC [Akkermansiaceae bacterium]